jgi:hypothetical protein
MGSGTLTIHGIFKQEADYLIGGSRIHLVVQSSVEDTARQEQSALMDSNAVPQH